MPHRFCQVIRLQRGQHSKSWRHSHGIHPPRYLLRNRDGIYGDWFRRRVKNMGIEEMLTAPHSP